MVPPLTAQGDAQGGARVAATHEDDDQHCEPAGYAPRDESRDEVARRVGRALCRRVSDRQDLLALVGRAVTLTTAEVVCPVREHTWISVIAGD